jgi:UDP-2-acetamido-2,6-beta-L-arabino-hexul-4-ose reductase
VTRGGHYHDSKVEKFLILEGEAVVRFRHVLGGELIEYRVLGAELRSMDIPPGYTHEIENVGKCELVVMFWANEIFDAVSPDTHALPLRDRGIGSL